METYRIKRLISPTLCPAGHIVLAVIAGPAPCLCIAELSIDFFYGNQMGTAVAAALTDHSYYIPAPSMKLHFWFRNIVADIWTSHELINTVVQ